MTTLGNLKLFLCTEETQIWEEVASLPVSVVDGKVSAAVAAALQENSNDTRIATLLEDLKLFSLKKIFTRSGTGLASDETVTTYLPLRQVHFETGKSTPVNQSEFQQSTKIVVTKLNDILAGRYRCLNEGGRKPTVFVVGHADRVGSETANQRISEERAEAIAREIKKGTKLRICHVGRGETEAGTEDNVSLQAARRADVLITSSGEPFKAKWKCEGEK